MLKLLAKSVTALSLVFSASFAAPAWSAGNSVDERKCTAKKHSHAKKAVTPPAKPAKSMMIVETRKQDVQILSFGP